MQRSTSFGRFEGIRQPSPARLEENVTTVTEESGCESSDQTKQGSLGKKMKAISLTMRRKMGKKHFKTFSEEAVSHTTDCLFLILHSTYICVVYQNI